MVNKKISNIFAGFLVLFGAGTSSIGLEGASSIRFADDYEVERLARIARIREQAYGALDQKLDSDHEAQRIKFEENQNAAQLDQVNRQAEQNVAEFNAGNFNAVKQAALFSTRPENFATAAALVLGSNTPSGAIGSLRAAARSAANNLDPLTRSSQAVLGLDALDLRMPAERTVLGPLQLGPRPFTARGGVER